MARTIREQSHYTAPARWREFTERLGETMYPSQTSKSFRAFTSTIPLEDKTVVMHDSRGFANTFREKLAMLRNSTDSYVYIAWPGKIETHVFRGTPGDILGALIEKAFPGEGR